LNLSLNNRVRVTGAGSWAIGTSLTVIAWHERCGERTTQNRIDQSLDTMRPGIFRARIGAVLAIYLFVTFKARLTRKPLVIVAS
jgi:hypothetical protein